MTIWQYRCQSCGGVHEVSTRPGGAMLLRCSETREWVWHDETAFLTGSGGASRRARNGAAAKGGTRTSRPARSASGSRASSRRASTPARAARKSQSRRPSSGRASKARTGRR
jgi:hypothetical protein